MSATATYRDRITGLKRVRAGDLKPHPQNWRKHPQSQVKAMRAALSEIGFADALLVRETGDGVQIVDGHLRAGIEPEQKVPCLFLDLDDEETLKLLATLDPLAGMAETDYEMLRTLKEQVHFETPEMNDIVGGVLGKQLTVDEDILPPPPPDAVSVPGDLWLLGRHRVICGDNADPEITARLFNGRKPDLCLTDPPYSIGLQHEGGGSSSVISHKNSTRKKTKSQSNRAKVESKTSGAAVGMQTYVDPDNPHDVWRFLDNVPGDVMVMTYCLTHGNLEAMHESLFRNKWEPRWELVWVKDTATVIPGAAYMPQHELIMLFARKGAKLVTNLKNLPTVFNVPRPRTHEFHPTQRPLELWTKLGQSHSRDSIYDPFLGSGTSIIVAENLARTGFGCEISPHFVDWGILRWQELTGEEAVHGESGETFSARRQEVNG